MENLEAFLIDLNMQFLNNCLFSTAALESKFVKVSLNWNFIMHSIALN